MGQQSQGEFSHKADPNLNTLISKIRATRLSDGTDAFSLYKQGGIPKSRLVEMIATEITKGGLNGQST